MADEELNAIVEGITENFKEALEKLQEETQVEAEEIDLGDLMQSRGKSHEWEIRTGLVRSGSEVRARVVAREPADPEENAKLALIASGIFTLSGKKLYHATALLMRRLLIAPATYAKVTTDDVEKLPSAFRNDLLNHVRILLGVNEDFRGKSRKKTPATSQPPSPPNTDSIQTKSENGAAPNSPAPGLSDSSAKVSGGGAS